MDRGGLSGAMEGGRTMTVYMPDGRPAPVLLTESEAIQFLRLDTIDLKHPDHTLRRYRDAGLLRCVQISRRIFYPVDELMAFIDRQKAEVIR